MIKEEQIYNITSKPITNYRFYRHILLKFIQLVIVFYLLNYMLRILFWQLISGWNSDGKKLASSSFDKSVAIFSLTDERLSKENTFRGHNGSVDQLYWHATDPSLLSTVSGDKTVMISQIKNQISSLYFGNLFWWQKTSILKYLFLG